MGLVSDLISVISIVISVATLISSINYNHKQTNALEEQVRELKKKPKIEIDLNLTTLDKEFLFSLRVSLVAIRLR